jgi:hypothetical protein
MLKVNLAQGGSDTNPEESEAEDGFKDIFMIYVNILYLYNYL